MCYSVVEKDELLSGHGNVTNLTDSSGAIVKTYSYDAFGVEQNPSDSDANPFRYCGEYYDSEIEQIYLRARYYDPSLGRFTQSDPAMANGMNWYVYCGNNPIAFADPSGFERLVISGSEEDGRFKYNFIETAIKQIRDWLAQDPNEWITWIISAPGYSTDDIQHFNDVAYDMGVGLQVVNSAAELQNYINSQDKYTWELSNSRRNDPITRMAFYAHGVEGSVELAYGRSNRSNFTVNSNFVGGLFSEAFNSPNIWFHSCNSATGGENSIAAAFYRKTSGYVGGYVNKTEYSYIMYPKEYASWKKVYSARMREIDADIDAKRSWFGFAVRGSYNYPVADEQTGAYVVTWGSPSR